jgi:trans-2,3-dihydro-3-hydroxyanthranilate isomerase
MPSASYVTVDVFTDQAFGGNPLAVFPDAAGLTTAQMMALTQELNLSESTFVTPGSAPGRFAVRIFTPGREMPFAGHPIVGTAVALAGLGRTVGAAEIVFELGVGPVRVALRDGGATFFRDGEAETVPLDVPDAEIAALIGVDALAGRPWQAGYGASYILVPRADRAAVAASALRLDLWRQIEPRVWGHALYVHAVTQDDGSHAAIHARMFAPALGVGEDPATGSAAAALVGSSPGPADAVRHLAITQGVEMGRPSRITATAARSAGRVTGISIGGGAVVVGEGRFTRLP